MPTIVELKALCKKYGVKGYSKLKKKQLEQKLASFVPIFEESGKKKLKRCPNGFRRDTKTGECVAKKKENLKKNERESIKVRQIQKQVQAPPVQQAPAVQGQKQQPPAVQGQKQQPPAVQGQKQQAPVQQAPVVQQAPPVPHAPVQQAPVVQGQKQKAPPVPQAPPVQGQKQQASPVQGQKQQVGKAQKRAVDVDALEVVRLIGKGGFGETVLVVDKSTGKKYIRKESVSNKESHMRYQYNMLLYLRNKNLCEKDFICPVEKYRDKKNRYFILFDFLDGYNIMYDLRHEPFEKRKKYCKDVLNLVKLLHKNNMVHNDIKNNNVMIDKKTDKVRIIDFGVAIIKDKKKYYDMRRGRGRLTDAPGFNVYSSHTFKQFESNDMWALGNLIYWFLYGNYPEVRTESERKLANKKIQKDINAKNVTFFAKSLL